MHHDLDEINCSCQKRKQMETRFTLSGVRMRRHSDRTGPLNWLLLPGGPGIGSESLHELADCLEVPGAVWLIDLPGDGSNTTPGSPFAKWPHVLIEAARAVPNPVYVGHSTGGMYLLDTPALRGHVRAIALLDTAPDASWHPAYVQMTKENPLPDFDVALAAYTDEPTVANLTDLVLASAPWNFTSIGLDKGRAMLARMPYNREAVEWSDANFDHSYKARWWPEAPVLRLWGEDDRIVSQSAWSNPRFDTPNVLTRCIPDAGHFPWIENPQAVGQAFREFHERLRSDAFWSSGDTSVAPLQGYKDVSSSAESRKIPNDR
jgi:pimeloyl-ACP methyl ester carboxylesterase